VGKVYAMFFSPQRLKDSKYTKKKQSLALKNLREPLSLRGFVAIQPGPWESVSHIFLPQSLENPK